MKEQVRTRLELVQIGAGILVTALAAVDMIGRPARLVSLVAIGGGMFGAGIGLGAALARRRLKHQS